MTKRMTKAVLGGVAGLGLIVAASGAANAQSMTFAGGPMKNLTIDLIFWGNFCTKAYCADRQDVFDYVADLASYLRGVNAPVGMEPALHYYGVSDITLGTWVAGTTDLFGYGIGQAKPGLDEMSGIVASARAGAYGPAYDFHNNYYGPVLPTGSNRLPVVVTLGINTLDDYGDYQGFHDSSNGNPYAASRWESIAVLSHEIFEAMTDPTVSAPVIFSGPGWSGQINFFTEVADQCENNWSYDGYWSIASTYQQPWDGALNWRGTTQPNNDDISGLASITVDPPYSYPNPAPQVSCEFFIPEQHAPLATTFEYGGNGQTPLALFYVDSAGRLEQLWWGAAGQTASGPYDYGQPSASVIAVGKPSVVYSLSFGERIFVRGSDGALWMRANGSWTSLGGLIFGDPKAIMWDNGVLVDVFALGTDDRLYFYGMTNSVLYGWQVLPNTGSTLFAGPPTVLSRTPTTLDVFATGEDANLKWMGMTSAGWAAPVTLSGGGNPVLSTPSALAQGANAAVFANAQFGLLESSWSGSSWYSPADAPFQTTTPDNPYGMQGTPAPVSWGPGRYDMFSVSRNGKLWWWASNNATAYFSTWSDVAPGTTQFDPAALVTSGVSGDPAAVTRYPGELEVFYRTTNGGLRHMTYNNTNNSWTTEQALAGIGTATIYDPPYQGGPAYQCNVGGAWMHCCPNGYVMVGADVPNNVFKCAPLDNPVGVVSLDTGTQRNGMHSCPSGSVMVGLRYDWNYLACQALPASAWSGEWVDTGTQDGFPVRVCGNGAISPMSGIQVTQNKLSCLTTSQIH